MAANQVIKLDKNHFSNPGCGMHSLRQSYLLNMWMGRQTTQTRWNSAVLDSNRLFYALWATMIFLVLIWGVYGINEVYALNWRRFGNHPRDWNHLWGIFSYPFLHGDLEHLWNNTATFFTLNGLLFYFYRSIAASTFFALFLLSGFGLWIFADGGNHIGASGVNYALASFLFCSGIFRKSKLLLRVSLLVAFLYGGMVWWMLPIDEHISWEGHIAGAISGVLWAAAFRNRGPLPDLLLPELDPAEKLPEWWAQAHPDDPQVREQRAQETESSTQENPSAEQTSITVNYRIKPSGKKENSSE